MSLDESAVVGYSECVDVCFDLDSRVEDENSPSVIGCSVSSVDSYVVSGSVKVTFVSSMNSVVAPVVACGSVEGGFVRSCNSSVVALVESISIAGLVSSVISLVDAEGGIIASVDGGIVSCAN